MSALDRPLSADELKAPAGQFRLVKQHQPKIGLDAVAFFLVNDFAEKSDALSLWRELMLAKRPKEERQQIDFTVYDDHGRICDAVGVRITEEERKAPPGMFRIICGDISTGVIKLVADLDDRDAAIEYANTADEGPYTGFQVHDDTGKALLPA